MDPDSPGSVEEQLRELRSRVQILEDTLRARGVALPVSQKIAPPPPVQAPAVPSAVVAAQTIEQPAQAVAYAPIPPPSFAAASIGKRDTRSLESRVGSQWFNRIGILAILIGMAWFLKFAIDNEWIGPLGRVVIGLIAGAGLIVWSERFRAKNYIAFSYSLKAVGTGVLYLSLWAAFSLYHLVPAPVAFLGMIAVTAFNGYLAWAQDAELLALYAIVGALGTPLLVLRDKTERPEAIASGNARLVGTSAESIVAETRRLLEHPFERFAMARPSFPFGDGRAAPRIAAIIDQWLGAKTNLNHGNRGGTRLE